MSVPGDAQRLVERTCAEQGLPVVIDDDATLERVSALIGRRVVPAPKAAA